MLNYVKPLTNMYIAIFGTSDVEDVLKLSILTSPLPNKKWSNVTTHRSLDMAHTQVSSPIRATKLLLAIYRAECWAGLWHPAPPDMLQTNLNTP